MSVVTSRLSEDEQKKLLSLFGHVRLHLLHKASIHGFTAAAFHEHCDKQGPTIIVAYNAAQLVFGAYTSKDFAQSDVDVIDDKAFLFSVSDQKDKPLRVDVIRGQSAFSDTADGPDFHALKFLEDDEPVVESNPGTGYNFQPVELHGSGVDLTELEVYRVEDLGDRLAKPWRNVQWTKERRQQLINYIQTYKSGIKSVRAARVLLMGAIGTGKSSFFNSINSIFRGNIMAQAIAGKAGTSVTTQFRTYTIKTGKGGDILPLVLCDTMGLEDNDSAGLDIEDLVNIYKGHVKDRYQFSNAAPLVSDAPAYRKHPTLSDTIHCAVYVIDACKVSVLSQKMLDKFTAIRKKTNQLGIPQLVLMTKVDEAWPLVAEDLKNIYHSAYIQKKANEVSELLGVPLSCVLPVKNYSQEVELDQEVDVLLLAAVQQMLNYADAFFENQMDEDTDDHPDLYRCNKNFNNDP